MKNRKKVVEALASLVQSTISELDFYKECSGYTDAKLLDVYASQLLGTNAPKETKGETPKGETEKPKNVVIKVGKIGDLPDFIQNIIEQEQLNKIEKEKLLEKADSQSKHNKKEVDSENLVGVLKALLEDLKKDNSLNDSGKVFFDKLAPEAQLNFKANFIKDRKAMFGFSNKEVEKIFEEYMIIKHSDMVDFIKGAFYLDEALEGKDYWVKIMKSTK